MALKTTLDSDAFGELDESTQQFYQETDNGYVLDVEGIDEHPSVQALKSGHKRSKDERNQYKQQLDGLRRRFGTLAEADDIDLSDVDPEKLNQLRPYLTGESELPSGDITPGKTPEELEKIRENARKPLQRDLDSIKGEAEKWQSLARRTMVDNTLASELARAGVKDPDYQELLIERFGRKCRIDFDGDKPQLLIDSEYGEVDPKEFVKEWAATEHARKFMDAPRNSGGGANGGSGSAKIKNPWSPEHWSMTEQTRIFKQDPSRAQAMAQEQGKRLG